MPVFQIIPDKFFSLLTSKHRVFYLDALFSVLTCYRQSMLIRKEDLISRLCLDLQERMMDWETEEEEDDEKLLGITLSERAHALIRRLVKTGWLGKESDARTFEDYYTVPEYAFKVLVVLKEISEEKPREYNTLVSSTYFTLRGADGEMDRSEYVYDALLQAHRMTLELDDSLRNLLHNLQRYHKQLQKQSQVREILAEHFDQYQELISEKIYHRLKTLDSVHRFKSGILQILKRWLLDEELVSIMAQRARDVDKDKAKSYVLHLIIEIMDVFERIPKMMAQIDKRNNAYIRASVDRLHYLLRSDYDLKGRLASLLQHLPDYRQSEKLIPILQEVLGFEQVSYINEDSLYKEPKRKSRHDPEPLTQSDPIKEEQINEEFKSFKQHIRRGITRQKVLDYIDALMENRNTIESDRLNIDGDQDFLKVIMSVVMSDERNMPYNVELRDGYVHVNGYRIPEMIFRKRR